MGHSPIIIGATFPRAWRKMPHRARVFVAPSRAFISHHALSCTRMICLSMRHLRGLPALGVRLLRKGLFRAVATSGFVGPSLVVLSAGHSKALDATASCGRQVASRRRSFPQPAALRSCSSPPGTCSQKCAGACGVCPIHSSLVGSTFGVACMACRFRIGTPFTSTLLNRMTLRANQNPNRPTSNTTSGGPNSTTPSNQ